MPKNSPRIIGVLHLGLVLCFIIFITGCSLLPHKNTPPAEMQLRTLRQKQHGTPEGIIPTELQAELMRYADQYGTVLSRSMGTFAGRLESADSRARAEEFKVDQASAAVFIAAGPQAHVSLLDMIVLVTLGRRALETNWAEASAGTLDSLLETYAKLETNLWALAARHLAREQCDELRTLIQQWRDSHPEPEATAFIRFADVAQQSDNDLPRDSTLGRSVLDLPNLDPLAGLGAIPRVTEQARFLTDRAMYWGQRLPVVAQWRSELLAAHLVQTPELRQLFSVAEGMTNTFAQLPALVTRERSAAIQQMFAELARQQTNLIAQLVAQEGQVSGFLTNVHSVLGSGAAAATAAWRLVDSTRELLGQSTNKEMGRSLGHGRPFDIREYATAMTELSASARDLNELMQATDGTLPKVLSQTASIGEGVANHLFKLGLIFGALIVAGLVVALLAYRYLGRKLFGAA
ncbi:MAG TPA: hypothetical protein VMZ27_01455 [Candidatus Saccharimonadales bacterium]|nr:hypothetical protein [Candidatus Saccharimonadales bacterium]